MPWSAVAGSAVGALVSSALAPSPAGAVAAADPFASQRAQYQTQLSQMMQPGSSFNPSDPSYAFSFNQGLTALNRSNAASGMGASGNALAGATAYGNQQAQLGYANQFTRLAELAGAGTGSPTAASQAITAANTTQQQGATAVGTAVGNTASNWFSSPSTTPTDTPNPTVTSPNTYLNQVNNPNSLNYNPLGLALGSTQSFSSSGSTP